MIRRVNPGWAIPALAALALSGCATATPRPVRSGDIPQLRERVAREPNDGMAHLLLAAALASADQCEEASSSARRGRALLPEDPMGPLILGRCLEKEGAYDEALNLYAQFLFEHGDAPGAQALEGQRLVALQAKARALAREALQTEQDRGPAESEAVGVLPFIVDGGPTYEALSVGLAHMLTTDLALLRRFPMVERAQLDALVQEMELAPNLIDPATAARTGRLMRASRMILGTVSVPSDAEARMAGNIVLESGEIVEPMTTEGPLNDLLSMEKDLALGIAEGLGYQLSEAERQRILENQPASLAAFLAFSRGLFEEERGDFEAAAAYYREALRADPEFGEAQTRLRGATGVEMGQARIAGLTFVPDMTPPQVGVFDAVASTFMSSVLDLASHQPERATIDVGTSTTVVDLVPGEGEILPVLEAVITIIITIPR